MTKKLDKQFHETGWAEISSFTEKCFQHKELTGLIVFLTGSFLTGLQISKMGIDMLPFFINSGNMVNIMFQLLLFMFVTVLFFMGIMIFCDIIHFISKYIIKAKRWLVVGSEYSDNSGEISTGILRRIVIGGTTILFLFSAVILLQMVVNNYPYVTIKTSLQEEAYLGQIIYNTGQGYIFNIDEDYVFIPNQKIEYINMGNPNQRIIPLKP